MAMASVGEGLMAGHPWARPLPVDGIDPGRPLVLLDIDGCLNVWDGAMGDGQVVDGDPVRVREISFPEHLVGESLDSVTLGCPRSMRIAWHPWLADAIAGLSDGGAATFAWLTSWNCLSRFAEEAVWPGRPSPVAGYVPWRLRGPSDDGRFGKALAIEGLLGSPRGRHGRQAGRLRAGAPSLVVIDDKACGPCGGPGPMGRAAGGAVPVLEVAPDWRHGVTRAQWAAIDAFVGGGPDAAGEALRVAGVAGADAGRACVVARAARPLEESGARVASSGP